MNGNPYELSHDVYPGQPTEPAVIVPEVVPEEDQFEPPPPPPRRNAWIPAMLFAATCLTTFFTGMFGADYTLGWSYILGHAFAYSGALMTILVCHEMGHFLQARRYGVYASYPYFIPMPMSPIGTFGAVIAMEAHRGDRKALFDIGISGPLAGLVPTIIFCIIGVQTSDVRPIMHSTDGLHLGEPLLFQLFVRLFHGSVPPGFELIAGPLAYAGWVGLLITSLNLIPIGQLDGGHILYALLRTRAHQVASLLLLAAVGLVVWNFRTLGGWLLMLLLLMVIGPIHPPTADDDVPLGFGRTVLGWLTLAFIPIGFTPTPFLFG